ncbi:class I SAM-dependent methyltransferase [Photobacterium sp. BZF1]|uniref:class I SAM-dependent methyltransferase n=1 Tax=Photobacterium sp. BZF1 TaxID=1904457 RepID=UPI001653A2B6|nr:class I SAM-dependent methyltransferase [Photobacterium sp. BZF1]MBC7003262.1 class I SAM-dependent methyltransferase [Photobacterium sp. BZF1]
MAPCPLCHSQSTALFFEDRRRQYFRCGECALIFADPGSRLSPQEEKAHYDLHENNPEDMGYRRFLARLADPLLERIGREPLDGLDFGCGPGPTLSLMLAEAGHNMAVYDPYFADKPAVLDTQYDFVTCTEAIEHFYTPAKEWGQLVGMVKPSGWLGLMTKLARDADAFAQWHYKNDPTHVSFFSRETFHYLAQRDGLDVEFVGNDVILLRKTQ